jgi:adenosylmethionine-8-amino-7-oxononanoate aminotransferase
VYIMPPYVANEADMSMLAQALLSCLTQTESSK